MVIAFGLHLFQNSSENFYLLAGSDGPYLPVQVKSLFYQHHLAFSDMPLLFVCCTMVAKFLFYINFGSENECILMAIKLVDTILPPLSAIPVLLISKELYSENIKAKISNYLLVAFSILSFTPLFLFSFQLQKNSIATIFIFTYLYYVLKIIKYQRREDIIKAIATLLLCLITHFGSFGLLLFITIMIVICDMLLSKEKMQQQTLKNILGIIILISITLAIIAFFDYTRFIRMVNVPFKIFEAPVLLYALNGQNLILIPPTLHIIIAMNFLALYGLLFLVLYRNQFEPYKLTLGIALGSSALFLSSPLLGLEWASRLFMLAYIPITFLYLILYNSTSKYWFKIPTLITFYLLLLLSMGTATFQNIGMTMDQPSFEELMSLRDKNIFTKKDLIVARQSLRILSNWTLETKGIDKYLLTKKEFNKYPNVYLIKQIKGKNPYARGSEPTLGDSTLLVYKGTHLEVYQLKSNAQLPDKPEKIFKGIRGTIKSISVNKLYVQDIKTHKIREIEIDTNNFSFPNLNKGMKVEINGEWKPFSLTIQAETIKKLESFEDFQK